MALLAFDKSAVYNGGQSQGVNNYTQQQPVQPINNFEQPVQPVQPVQPQPMNEQPQPKVCPNCGTQLAPNAEFCGVCGTKI